MPSYTKVNDSEDIPMTTPNSPSPPFTSSEAQSDFQPLLLQPNASSSSSSSTSQFARPPVFPGSSTSRPTQDGVFNNLSAKPTVIKQFQELEPPSYVDAVGPSNTDTRIIDPNSIYVMDEESGELLIEGYPVGNLFILFMNMLISMTFDLVGFLLTSLLAQTHAAKAGARLGLGLTMIRYSILIRAKESEQDDIASNHFENIDSPSTTKAQKEWTSYVLFFFGFLLVMHANADYFRIMRLRNMIQTRSIAVDNRV